MERKKTQNQSLVPYLVSPASKQSKSSLQGVREYVDEHKFLSNWNDIDHGGCGLPSTGDKHHWCGMWQTFGCLHSQEHQRLGKGNRIYVKQYQRSCYRPACRECYLKWIARQANASTKRIEQYEQNTKHSPIHLLLSVNPNQYHLSYRDMKKTVKSILKTISFIGGAVIFHPYKFNKTSRRWYYAPHFHIVGFGWRSFIFKGYGKFGWFVKDLGVRKSVFQTFCYLLSHCGIKKGVHSVSWMGDLSYSKLKVEKEPKIIGCPVCGRDFVPVYYNLDQGVHPVVPPDRHFEGLVDDDGEWYQVKTGGNWKDSEPSYEYDPRRDTNDILKNLAEAN
ncbi:MAG: hypothetical protein OEY17_07965 [Nitrosopumilus sp.]|nr:hypothetical protein [Nitrosopumilus sp.]